MIFSALHDTDSGQPHETSGLQLCQRFGANRIVDQCRERHRPVLQHQSRSGGVRRFLQQFRFELNQTPVEFRVT